jgi:16S rRNA (guanine1207-N2)-methyltransferase
LINGYAVSRLAHDDTVPHALGDALASGELPLAGEAVWFLRARAGAGLAARVRDAGWHCQQSFKPLADALGRSGLEVQPQLPDGPLDGALLLPPRSREESRALFAQALARLRPGGVLVAAMANNAGARSGEADLTQLAGLDGSVSRRRCRVFWTARDDARIDAARLSEWRALDAVRPILDGRFVSRPGLFAWDRIDTASALLAAHLPVDLTGRVADLGAGFGYLGAELLERCPAVTALDAYEAEARALQPLESNLQAARERGGSRAQVGVHWHDATTALPTRYDVVVSNPPFHQGRADEPALGQAFIRTAAAALVEDGGLWLVANRHLPYERTLREAFVEVATVADAEGFKVLHARNPRR